MRLRPLELFAAPICLVVGSLTPPGILGGDVGRIFVIFLGLVAASVLPTVSLLINSMSSNGRSVLSINNLKDEISIAVDALFLLFGCVVVIIGFLVAISIPFPFPSWVTKVTVFGVFVPYALGQTAILFLTSLIILRIGQIPAILRRSLLVRHEIAVTEAQRKIRESSISTTRAADIFPKREGFGRSIDIADVK